jgi:sensor histidine kinase regulating citrate/malate metabolism
MNTSGEYVLAPSAFKTMQEAQELVDALEVNLRDRDLGAANVRPELVELVSELVNNAAEHGLTPDGAHVHVRFMPHRRGHAFDCVVSDEGPGIRATLAANSALPKPETDGDAIRIAIQELVSGTGSPNRGIGLWQVVAEMRRPGRKLMIQSGSGLLVMYGESDPEQRATEYRQGTMVRLTVPA